MASAQPFKLSSPPLRFPVEFSNGSTVQELPYEPVASTSHAAPSGWPDENGSPRSKKQLDVRWSTVKTSREALLQDLESQHAQARCRPHGKSPVRNQSEASEDGELDSSSEVEREALLPPPAQPTLSENPDMTLSQDTATAAITQQNGDVFSHPQSRLQFNTMVRIAGQRPHRPSHSGKDLGSTTPFLRPHPRRNSSVVTPSVLSRSSSPASSIYAPLASALPTVPSPRRALHFFSWSRKGLQVPADLGDSPHSDGNYRTLVQEQSQRRATRASERRRGRRRRSSAESYIAEEPARVGLWQRWFGGPARSERQALFESDEEDEERQSWSDCLSSWFCCCLHLDEDSDDEG